MRETLPMDDKTWWWTRSDDLEKVCNDLERTIKEMPATAPLLKQAAQEVLIELDFSRQRLNAAITQVDTVLPPADPDPAEVGPAWRATVNDSLDDIPF